jgi:hypothetical protein
LHRITTPNYVTLRSGKKFEAEKKYNLKNIFFLSGTKVLDKHNYLEH